MKNDKSIYKGNTSIISREIDGENYELAVGHYEAAVAVVNTSFSHVLLTRVFSPTSNSEEWVLPNGALLKDSDSMRSVAVTAAAQAGVEIDSNKMNTLVYYYPCINYDICKHVVYIIEVPDSEIKNLLKAGDSKWFSFTEIEEMLNESSYLMDGRTILAIYKLLFMKLKGKPTN